MTRKLLVKVIASLCLLKGLLDIGNFFYPFFFSPENIVIKIVPLIGGILEISAGINLFRLRGAGRELILALLYIQTAIMALFTFWILLSWKDGYGFDIRYVENVIFTSESRFLATVIYFVFLAIPTLIILFLSQRKTKALFAPEITNTADSKAPVDANSSQITTPESPK